MRVRSTVIGIGAALTVSMLGPPGAGAQAEAPAAKTITAAQPRADETARQRACYVDIDRPCAEVAKKWRKKVKRGKMHTMKKVRWKKLWKKPAKARRMFTRKLRRAQPERYAGWSSARVFRNFKRGLDCVPFEPDGTPNMCFVKKRANEPLPNEIKILGACAGGRAMAAALIPGVGWAGFGGATAECFFVGWLGYRFGSSGGRHPTPVA